MAEDSVLRSGRVGARDVLRVAPKDEKWRIDLRCGVFVVVPFAVLGDQPSGVLFDMDDAEMPRLCGEESRKNEHPCPRKMQQCLINVASP